MKRVKLLETYVKYTPNYLAVSISQLSFISLYKSYIHNYLAESFIIHINISVCIRLLSPTETSETFHSVIPYL